MPSKNKPKRFDRKRKFEVARRRKRKNLLLKGSKRSRKKRPKNKKIQQEE
ncbi:MAG: hypothetical protein PHX15_00465 [Candidatus Nanoarchaeia archaeon]|jgi:hypothetical protein|nr:hypothetical protein [Candidatus Nanoarchaeia archaeon]MDD3993657.1 hypothetical protein [Candidatus Nanoarchaeia archaeon]MDD4563604.1 hypothetical protein [Candidatus Nanoarchaeia archaeon]